MSRAHVNEDRWHQQFADADEMDAVAHMEALHRAEQRRRHDLVMAHMRMITQGVKPAPSSSLLARAWRAVVRWL